MKYFIMVDYGLEGWKIWQKADSLLEARKIQKEYNESFPYSNAWILYNLG